MKTIKDVLHFYNAAIFYDFKNIGLFDELNQTHGCGINILHEIIPVERILVTLSIIDIVILKITVNDNENVIENIDDLRSNILYMIGFDEVLKDDVDKVMN